MEGARKSSMSYEELKSKLLQRFQKQGIFQEMKAQMRSKLVEEFYQTVPYLGRDSPDGDERGMLPAQVSNWLVYDHLQREKYEFTLSTFLQESGMVKSPKKILGTRDVLHLLGVSEHLAKNLNAVQQGEQSFLFTVVRQAMALQVRSSKVIGGESSWREQLRFIDETFDKQKNVQTKEENEYQKVMKEVEELRKHIDQELKKSQVREQRARPFDSHSTQHSPGDGKPVEPQVLGNSSAGDVPLLLKSSESDLLKHEDNFNQTVEHRIKVIENDIMKKWITKKQQLQEWEERLRLKADRLEQDRTEEELVQESAARRLQQEKLKVEQLYNQQQILQNENELLKKTLEETADYKILKSELVLAKKEAKMSLDRFESSQREWLAVKERLERTIAELTMKLSNPCSQLLKAHQEMKKIQDAYRLDNSVWNKQQNDLEKELQEIKQLYQRTLLRNEGQRRQLESQEMSFKTLNQQLQEVQLTLVEKDHIITRMNSSHLSAQGSFKHSTDHIPGLYDLSPDYFLARMDTLSFLTETKKRIEGMQAEGEMLEKRYRHIIDAPAFSLNPPRTTLFGSTPNLGPSLQEKYMPSMLGYESRQFKTEMAGLDYSRHSFSGLDDAIHLSGTYPHEDAFNREHVQGNRSRVARRLESELLHRDPKLRASMPILTESPSSDREQAQLCSGLYKPQSLSSLRSKPNTHAVHSLTRTGREAIDISNKNNGIPTVIISRTGSVHDLSLSENSGPMSRNESQGLANVDQELSAIEHSPKLSTLPPSLAVKEDLESRNEVEISLSLKPQVKNSNGAGSNSNNTRSKTDAKSFINEVINIGQRTEVKMVTNTSKKSGLSTGNISEVTPVKTENKEEMAIGGRLKSGAIPPKGKQTAKEMDTADDEEPEAEFWKVSVPTHEDFSGNELEKSESLAAVEASFYPKSLNVLDSIFFKSNNESDSNLSKLEGSPLQLQAQDNVILEQDQFDVSRTNSASGVGASQHLQSQKNDALQDNAQQLLINQLDVTAVDNSKEHRQKLFQPEQHSTPVPEKSSTDCTRGDIEKETNSKEPRQKLFQPEQHSTPVPEKSTSDSTRGDIEKETSLVDDKSDAELNISIGEQKTISDDSFW